MNPLKIAFWGTPPLTTHYLDALYAAGFGPSVVITNPDRPKGRGQELTAPAAKVWALSHDIPVLQPEKLDDAFYAELEALDLGLSVVVAYGSILPERFITLPRHQTLNVHYSRLPEYRGASPVEASILAGHTETGVSIQEMVKALDNGPIIADEKYPIDPDITTPELREKLSLLGAELLVKTIPNHIAGTIHAVPQNDTLATFCGKTKKEDGLLDLAGDAAENYRKYRAYAEWPRTYFFYENGNKTIRVIITKASFKEGSFVVERVLPEGKKEMSFEDFKRGMK